MKWGWIAVAMLALLISACGSPYSGADNCSELGRVAAEELAGVPDEEFEAASDPAIEAARAMAEDAIARGADTEAQLCLRVIEALQREQIGFTFDEIGNALSGDE